jgi:HPt (histidine-containing phosphotransfer) domain-containing protein
MGIALWVLLIHLGELMAIGVFLLIRRNRKLEQALIQQQQYIDTLNILFNNLTESLDKVDEKVWVNEDEELAEVFNNISQINKTINSL